jgi:hypothetical protein
MPPIDAQDVYRRLKVVPHAKLLAEGRAAMVRFSEEQMEAEKRQIEERARRFGPVQRELVAALRKSPELAAVVQAIDALERPSRPSALPQARKRVLAPQKSLVRLGSIHVVESLPFNLEPQTWTWQNGDSNVFTGPSADGTTGNMSFEMLPGVSSNGHMAC